MAILTPLVFSNQCTVFILDSCIVLPHRFNVIDHMGCFSPHHKYLNIVDGFGNISSEVHFHLICLGDGLLDFFDALACVGEVELTG